MYSGPIIDPHHHLWALAMNKHTWLSPDDATVQALPGLSTIAQDFLPENYRRAAAAHNVVATVHIEALWAGDPTGETEWLESLDKREGVALRYIANAKLGTPDAARLIDAQARFERVVGVRGILSNHPDPKKSFVPNPRLGYDPAWRKDVARLRDHGLNLELMMYPYQADAVLDLATTFPDLQIVINHCGSPIDRDPAGMQRWREGLRAIGGLQNVAIKISNPGAYDPNWTLGSIQEVALHCIACFGTDRAMFGTDYPVSRIQMNFDEIYQAFKNAVRDFSADEQRALFFGNARRLYRLENEVAA